MTWTTSVLFYLLFGAGIGVAVYLYDQNAPRVGRPMQALAAIFFWPLFLPLLLQSTGNTSSGQPIDAQPYRAADVFDQSIEQVESELDTALKSLDGWAEGVLSEERDRLGELRTAWRTQADRIREIDRLLTQPDFVESPIGCDSNAKDSIANRRRQSELGRSGNIRRLHELRRRMYDDFAGTLAWVRELVTMIHLAKFSGAPASRAEELVSQIAAAVEGLQEASDWWDDERREVTSSADTGREVETTLAEAPTGCSPTTDQAVTIQ